MQPIALDQKEHATVAQDLWPTGTTGLRNFPVEFGEILHYFGALVPMSSRHSVMDGLTMYGRGVAFNGHIKEGRRHTMKLFGVKKIVGPTREVIAEDDLPYSQLRKVVSVKESISSV